MVQTESHLNVSLFLILLPVLILVGLFAAAILAVIFGGKYGSKIAAGLTIAFLGMMLLCGGFFFVGYSTTQTMTSDKSVAYSRVGVQEHPYSVSETHMVASERPQVRLETARYPVPSPSLSEESTASTGKSIGKWAGSLYQGFRNQLKSGEIDLDPSKIIPPGRPSWVEQTPHWTHDQTYYVAVSSGPYDRGMDCQRALDFEVDKAIDQFAIELTGSEDAPALIGEELESLHHNIVAETYQEELTPSFGIMHQWHSLLKFDPAIQGKIREFWIAQQRISRVVYIGAGFLFLLGLMSTFYAGMSLTGKGSRISPWLVSAGSVVALGGLFAAGVIFVRSFPML
ncbi:hypothetical protein ACYFX5_17750 [Bremerella sp. T1]|uniref:hypothetical protein n=1 Tax=Bremerella sp. TYQ1 TaxID=3119568 RepID=UPI001CCADAA0|nr:hypothetical protein [Bremerella volcania]UBM34900.1 hypothetical protein LA756_19705 [Bremerella volcania]